MRLALLALLLSLTLPGAAAARGAFPGHTRGFECERTGARLERIEALLDYLRGRDGPLAGFLRAYGGHVARGLANRIADRCVHLNEIQVLGSHNSYHQQPAPSEFNLIRFAAGDLAQGFEY